MIKQLYIYLLFTGCFLQITSHAQNQANYWYFGKKVGLNFNQSPPQVLSDGSLQSIEGSASISDQNGNLLFYTNGVSIANKDHQPMVNGGGIMGDLSSTNNTVIVQLPETDSIYYLFTVGAAGQLANGLRYSIINMKRQNGLGEVVQKNGFLYDNTFEKLAAVRHCNRKDVWITVKDWESDAYYTYLLTKDGVNTTPVISNMGVVTNGWVNNSLGTLKFSSDGKKLISIHSFDNDLAQLMDFDNSTGILTNPVTFKPNGVQISPGFTGVYGAAFSPDNKLLYISSRKSNIEKSVLYQFDISVHDETAIMNSRYIIASQDSWDAGAVQTGPDGKIYYAQWKDTALSVIMNPNIAGVGCDYRYNSITFPLINEPVQFGLPNFIASDLDSNYFPFDFSWDLGSCNSLTARFEPNRTTGIDSVKWAMGDGNSYQTLTPQHTYLLPGTYTVTLEVFRPANCGSLNSEIITHTMIVGSAALSAFLPGDTSFCSTFSYTIKPTVSSNTYLWNTGAVSKDLTVQTPGLYWLELSQNGCTYRDTILVGQSGAIHVNVGADKVVCINKPVQLTAVSTGTATSYLWSTGSTASSIQVNMPDTYWVEVRNAGGCVATDTLKTTWGDCETYIPTAFSPNGDGINETFGLINGISSTVFTFYIYNRYGQLVFSTSDPYQKWDGKLKGKPSPNGAYIWMMTYKNRDGFIQTDKGTVMLIR